MFGKWIKTEDKLPEQGTKVLCIGPKGGWYIGEVFCKAGKSEWYSPGKTKPWPVAWMPLPTPYTDKKYTHW